MRNLRPAGCMFFNGWYPLLRILVVGALAYAGLVLLLRISGKRTLSQMNAFDLVVTVALGSTLASTFVSRNVALLEGLLAFAVLISLQFIITWASVRFPAVQRLIKARPRLLAYDGELMEDALRSERVTRVELDAAVRSQGLPGIGATHAVILETDGTITAICSREGMDDYGALDPVRGVPDDR